MQPTKNKDRIGDLTHDALVAIVERAYKNIVGEELARLSAPLYHFQEMLADFQRRLAVVESARHEDAMLEAVRKLVER